MSYAKNVASVTSRSFCMHDALSMLMKLSNISSCSVSEHCHYWWTQAVHTRTGERLIRICSSQENFAMTITLQW